MSELYLKTPSDILIIDKLVMAKIKVYDKETALGWVEEHKRDLESILTMPFGENMYSACLEKIRILSETYAKKGLLYKTFEEALKYYHEYGVVSGNTEDVEEFNSLMEFMYVGRREQERIIEELPEDKYLIDKIM